MDIVKKNLLSIIFAVVAIACVVANFVPMGGKRKQLIDEATSHAAKAAELKGLLTKPRSLPTVKPGDTTAEPLTIFPTRAQLEEAHKATELVNKTADHMMDVASGD